MLNALAQSAQDIDNDETAVDILNRVCVLIVNGNNGKAGGDDGRAAELRFTHDVNDIFAGADFSLFLCMLIMNREGLVCSPLSHHPSFTLITIKKICCRC
jgi:hypothetical protein